MTDETPQGLIRFPRRPEDRLRVALRELEVALEEQALAFQEFRANMAVLGTAVHGLQNSLEGYRGSLDNLALDVQDAHETAIEVMRNCDRTQH